MLNTSRHEILVFNVWTAETPRCRSSRIGESKRDTWEDRQPKLLHDEGMSSLLRKGTCKHQVTTEILYTFHVRLIKWWTHPFDSTQRTKLSFVAQWDSGKRSLSTEVKISSNILSGTTSMACLYVPWSRANVIASAAYKQFSSLVERGKMRCENPQRPLGSYN